MEALNNIELDLDKVVESLEEINLIHSPIVDESLYVEDLMEWKFGNNVSEFYK